MSESDGERKVTALARAMRGAVSQNHLDAQNIPTLVLATLNDQGWTLIPIAHSDEFYGDSAYRETLDDVLGGFPDH